VNLRRDPPERPPSGRPTRSLRKDALIGTTDLGRKLVLRAGIILRRRRTAEGLQLAARRWLPSPMNLAREVGLRWSMYRWNLTDTRAVLIQRMSGKKRHPRKRRINLNFHLCNKSGKHMDWMRILTRELSHHRWMEFS
jgi:hypothetical protein